MKKMKTFEVKFPGGGKMIIRSTSRSRAAEEARQASRALGSQISVRVEWVKQVIPTGFQTFEEASV